MYVFAHNKCSAEVFRWPATDNARMAKGLARTAKAYAEKRPAAQKGHAKGHGGCIMIVRLRRVALYLLKGGPVLVDLNMGVVRRTADLPALFVWQEKAIVKAAIHFSLN